MTSAIDICVIEPDGDQRRTLVDQLEAAGYRVAQAATGDEGLAIALGNRPKIVLSRWTLPGIDGMAICRRLKQPENGDTYFILLSDSADVQRNALALETGADDYLIQPCPPRELLARVHVGMRFWTLQQKLRDAALTDGLTGLWTHQHFAAILKTEFARCRRYGGQLSLIMCDLDHFKAINDSFGHQTGNAVLKQTADAIRGSIRHPDVPVRYGGEEFAILAPEADLPDAVHMAERLRAVIEKSVKVEGHDGYRVTVSLGVASVTDQRVVTPEDLVELADRTMYLAKRRGRNRVCSADELPTDAGGREVLYDPEVRELHQQVARLSLRTRESYVQGIWALVQALEARDPCTANHSRNVTAYAEAVCEEMRLPDALKQVVINAAMLHDIGKIGIPDSLLQKRGDLTAKERRTLQQIPLISARIIDHMRILDNEVAIIRHQREYFDGSGYPRGLKGAEIPLGSRIILAAAAFDAMTTDRAYRRHLAIDEALAELRAGAGTQFDPAVVDALTAAARRHTQAWQARISASLAHAVAAAAAQA
ncbi:MAG: diguanylate cyclase [Phycisphaerae bacterium]